MCLLDKTNSGDYDAFAKVNDDFIAALKKRKELKGVFTFFANNYPQYEIIKHKGGQQTTVVPWAKSDSIRTGASKNQLEVRARGAEAHAPVRHDQ